MSTTEQVWYARLGRRLREERLRRGWTIYDVAALVDRSGVAVSLWERGTRRMKAYDYDRLRSEGMVEDECEICGYLGGRHLRYCIRDRKAQA